MIRTTKKSITKQRKSMIKKTKEKKYEKLEKMKGIRNTKKKNKDI